jgi:hypothetical protein
MNNCKGCGKKQANAHLRYDPTIFLDGLRKTLKNFNQNSRSLSEDFNLGPPNCEAEMLPISFG